MENEIKEILDKLNSALWEKDEEEITYKILFSNEVYKLLDYITNLQQENETRQQDINNLTYQLAKIKEENEKLSDKIEFYEDVDSDRCAYNEELQKENERLKELCDKYEEEHNNEFKMWKEERYDLLDYKSRCEKAIEYLDKVETLAMLDGKIIFSINIFRNILQNGSEKDE